MEKCLNKVNINFKFESKMGVGGGRGALPHGKFFNNFTLSFELEN